jgi:hypothetical protein
MDQIFCPHCRLEQPTAHSYCARCGVRLPVDLLAVTPAKTARFFAGVKVSPDDPEGAFLRVSCYLKEQMFHGPEGSVTIPGQHVRFSVWVGNESRCVLSIPATEAKDLGGFLLSELARLDSAEAHSHV